ncbi:FadR/GntR family transcriptional regulator [Bifidobacterium ruminantium]|uniref:FadR/GntR family transcriptional regulator n=1 Tax=Bifidobacterium ruminantium TaxID=78346 RepID=UPI0009DDB6A1|nr:GntR family transcriptional regulator [Bifidobacterium ruminantium]
MKSNDVGDVFLKTGTGKASEIASLLEQRIAAGGYPAGSKLPSERELAVSFHVSRNTIRDAIALLAARKIVSTKWGSGTVVLGPRTKGPWLLRPDLRMFLTNGATS